MRTGGQAWRIPLIEKTPSGKVALPDLIHIFIYCLFPSEQPSSTDLGSAAVPFCFWLKQAWVEAGIRFTAEELGAGKPAPPQPIHFPLACPVLFALNQGAATGRILVSAPFNLTCKSI